MKGIDNDLDWDEDDVKVGRGLYLLTILVMLAVLIGIVWTGYNRMALIGWPLLGGTVFVFLRVWKNMLRNTIDEVVEIVDLEANIFDKAPISVVREQSNVDISKIEKTDNLILISLGLLVYAVFITVFWYGIGRGVVWIVDLF